MNTVRNSTLRLVCVLGLCFFQNTYSASVVAVSKAKALIKLNGGTNEGLAKGTKVCIVDANNKNVACGKIVKESADVSYLRVSKKQLKKIQKGMIATITEKKNLTKGTLATATDHRRHVKLGYLFTVLTPSTFKKVFFLAPEDKGTEALETTWQTASQGVLPVGAYMEFDLGIGEAMSMAFGLRYRSLSKAVVDSNYVAIEEFNNAYVSTTHNYSAFGVYFDFGFLRISNDTNSVALSITTGLDIDISNLSIQALREDEETEVATYQASMTTTSLRFGFGLDLFPSGPFGIYGGLNAMVPLAGKASVSKAEVLSDEITTARVGSEDEQIEDFTKAIDFKKSSVAFESVLSAYFAF